MRSIFTFLCVSVLSTACCGNRKLASGQQGIRGQVKEVKGNQMPGPGVKLPPASPFQTTLYVFELTSLSEVEKAGDGPLYRSVRSRLVDSVRTDAEGKFHLSVPPAQYSIFVKVDGFYFANLFDQNNHIHPVIVEPGKFIEVNITVNNKAYY